MIDTKAKCELDPSKLKRAVKTATFVSLNNAGGAIRLTASRSIKINDDPSPVGTPPHTRKSKQLRHAIKYAVEKSRGTVVIGPDVANVGTSGKAHEFGGQFRREHYDRRPFMGPALEAVRDRLPALWAGSVK